MERTISASTAEIFKPPGECETVEHTQSVASRSEAEGTEVPIYIGSLNRVPSTKGALPEVLPLGTLKGVTGKRADPTEVTALPYGEPDRVLELPNAEGRDGAQHTQSEAERYTCSPSQGDSCGVPDLRQGKVDTGMRLMALPTVVKKQATPMSLWDLCAGEHNWPSSQQHHTRSEGSDVDPVAENFSHEPGSAPRAATAVRHEEDQRTDRQARLSLFSSHTGIQGDWMHGVCSGCTV